MENKKTICEKLTELLQLTRAGEDVIELNYIKDEFGDEFVKVKFSNEYTKEVNISGDSGLAMIRDITRVL